MSSVSRGKGIGKNPTHKPKAIKTESNRSLIDPGVFEDRWVIRPYLVYNVPGELTKSGSTKVAAFDMDSTLIDSKSGLKFGRGPHDWKWWHKPSEESTVISKLLQLMREEYLIVIFTNQGSLAPERAGKSFNNLKTKLGLMVRDCKKNGLTDILVYASVRAPRKNQKIWADKIESMRKPNIGMWEMFLNYIKEQGVQPDMDNSFFVGDAAGRPDDFSDSDKKFADGIGIKFYTPEEFFYPMPNHPPSKSP